MIIQSRPSVSKATRPASLQRSRRPRSHAPSTKSTAGPGGGECLPQEVAAVSRPQVIDDQEHERVYDLVAAIDVAKDVRCPDHSGHVRLNRLSLCEWRPFTSERVAPVWSR